MVGTRGAERRQRIQSVGIDEVQHFRRIGEVSDLALVAGNLSADQRHQLRRDFAALLAGGWLMLRSAEGRLLFMRRQPIGSLLDDAKRHLIAGLRGIRPSEEPMAAKYDADIFRMARGHLAELEAKIKARPLPGQKTELAAENLACQSL